MILGQLGQQKFATPHLNRKKLEVMTHACHPNDGRKHKLRGPGLGWPGKKNKTLSSE
jgi:hypothetical protein